jgi:hypothetical protein
LESVKTLLLSPSYGTAAGDGILLVGSQVRLDSKVKQETAVWRSTKVNDGWSRIELPELGDRSQGNTATCTSSTACTISGFVDGKLAIWQVDGGQGKRLANVPAIAVGDKDKLPPPVVADGHVYQLIAEGNKVKVVSGHDGSWTVQESTGPEGVVTDAALIGKTLYLLAGPADKPASLWKTTLN